MKLNRKGVVAAVQAKLGHSIGANHKRLEKLVREAAGEGAGIVLLPELFQGPYFCKTEMEDAFDMAYPVEEHPSIHWASGLARELEVVLPVSFFEVSRNHYYNSLVVVDADGSVLETYRKSHIPDGPGYEEKFYFRPGNTGFRVWRTRYGVIGAGICWDQWFPECARALTLLGAELLLYPTAIGSEPEEPELDTRQMWQGVMKGHAIANVIPVVAANRTGVEDGQAFYGHSFICDHQGQTTGELEEGHEGFILSGFDFDRIRRARATMGFFRDRRPELYGGLVEA